MFRFSKKREGIATLWVLMLTMIVITFSLSALKLIESDLKFFKEIESPYYLQARNMAKAGLIETLNWFRRQPTQPVLVFNPGPQDSQDPQRGIVYEREVRPNYFIGYEVLKENVIDISEERGLQPGTIWRITSIGYVRYYSSIQRKWIRKQRQLTTEIIRITMFPPVQAAIISPYAWNVLLADKVRVIGNNSAGVASTIWTGIPVVLPPANLRGTPRVQFIRDPEVPPWPWRRTEHLKYYDEIISIESVFGVSEDTLRSVADISTSNPADIPQDFENLLIYFQGNLSFTDKPLRGTGVLVVTGDLRIDNSTYNYFSGLIYVRGHVDISGNVLINGTLINERVGKMIFDYVNLDSSKDWVEVSYDSNILNSIRLHMGNYRFCSPMLPSDVDRRQLGF